MPASEPKFLPGNLITALFHPWTWRMAWRDSRSQRLRLAIFSLAIVSGIAALVAIHSLKASVENGIATQAKALLGSDVQITSRRAFTDEEYQRLQGMAASTSREISFPSMVKFPNGSARLLQIRGIEGAYPFYGKVETTPPEAWQQLQAEQGILVEQALLDQFQARPGDTVELGSIRLTILGVVNKPAPRSSRFSGFAPEAYVRLSDVMKTGLLGTNSMSSHAVHLELPPGSSAEAAKAKIRADFNNTPWRLETPEDRRENLGDALDNFQRFLGIIALASLVLGAIGVAGAVHAHVSRRVPTIAILRCLGCPRHLACAIYFAQAGALGLIGAIAGALLGIALQTGVLLAFQDQLPLEVSPSPEWKVVAQTTAAGFAVCCGFALLPLLKIRRISPAATLRSGATLEGRPLRAIPLYLLLGGLLVLLAFNNDSDWKRALALVGGLGVAFVVLALVAKLLILVTRKSVSPAWPYLLRQGISNLHRPRNQTLLFLLSLGLGTFLLVTILLTGSLINKRLDITQSAQSPNIYLVDVQPDQVQGVKDVLAQQSLPLLEAAPMVTMRIESVRGVPVRDAKGIPRWVSRREFRSTYRDYLNPTETLTAGEWHKSAPTDGSPVPLSLEEKIATDMGLSIGDEIVLDVQGASIPAKITSLRKVDWSRFNLNFFMVFPPGVLEDAPGFHVVTTKTANPSQSGELQRALVGPFANVTAIDLTLILETVQDILGKISAVVSVLAGFTVLAGVPILIGTLLNGRDLRLRESVLLRTLGASAKQVRAILTIEYTALGLLSALTGITLAVAANAGLAIYVFKADPWPDLGILMAAFGSTIGLSVIGGLLLSRGVCNHPPLEILRSGI
ncbi:ABC transporter permease [Luteolibacter sp. GHJ8]|uniref:ABC transporter permease n=1 Tax=Luteolibacter rhizosphaerae TaxID=2989719 RepID=A0ABT3G2P9_9BACT|nr:FtsX-like permease family protein [Luteolibacter rhizosphaerae]MCW1914122.1 ABC transporter permease [Luteolibacter rhizosphaerae]